MFQNVVFAICRNKNIFCKMIFFRDEHFWGTIRYSCFDWIPHLEPPREVAVGYPVAGRGAAPAAGTERRLPALAAALRGVGQT